MTPQPSEQPRQRPIAPHGLPSPDGRFLWDAAQAAWVPKETWREAAAPDPVASPNEYEVPCPGGCGCRIGTVDADRDDCACGGYCQADPSDWPAFSLDDPVASPSAVERLEAFVTRVAWTEPASSGGVTEEDGSPDASMQIIGLAKDARRLLSELPSVAPDPVASPPLTGESATTPTGKWLQDQLHDDATAFYALTSRRFGIGALVVKVQDAIPVIEREAAAVASPAPLDSTLPDDYDPEEQPRTVAGRKLLRIITTLDHRIHELMPQVARLDYDASSSLIQSIRSGCEYLAEYLSAVLADPEARELHESRLAAAYALEGQPVAEEPRA